MRSIFKTIAKDIIVLSAQVVTFRLAAPQDQQQGVIFAAVATKGPEGIKALPAESEAVARKVGF